MPVAWVIAAAVAAAQPSPADYAADAKALDRIIVENYAYEDHWPGGRLLPAERLYTVGGLPREKFVPRPVRD